VTRHFIPVAAPSWARGQRKQSTSSGNEQEKVENEQAQSRLHALLRENIKPHTLVRCEDWATYAGATDFNGVGMDDLVGPICGWKESVDDAPFFVARREAAVSTLSEAMAT